MRIATSTIYSEQTNSIDNLAANYQNLGHELSTGKRINQPSDDPTLIGPDLLLHTTIAQQNQDDTSSTQAVNELTTVDSTLSSLTNLIQSARQLAVRGASDTLSDSQRQAVGTQIDQLLQEAVGLANTTYQGRYIFGGTKQTATPPLRATGSPANTFNFFANEEVRTENINGQQFTIGTTLHQAFNFQSTDGSSDVFTVLANLRDTLNKNLAVDQSAAPVNLKGQDIYAGTTLAAAAFSVPLQPDSNGRVALQITGPGGTALVDVPTTTTLAGLAAAISGSGTGVTAVWNQKAQRLSLSASGSFNIADAPSQIPAAATNTANLVNVFGLQNTGYVVQNVSTQLGDIDKILQTTLNARASVGSTIQALSALGDQLKTGSTDNVKVQSNYEDADIAATTAAFSQTQTALQAAYATTTRLEGKTLFDYIQ